MCCPIQSFLLPTWQIHANLIDPCMVSRSWLPGFCRLPPMMGSGNHPSLVSIYHTHTVHSTFVYPIPLEMFHTFFICVVSPSGVASVRGPIQPNVAVSCHIYRRISHLTFLDLVIPYSHLGINASAVMIKLLWYVDGPRLLMDFYNFLDIQSSFFFSFKTSVLLFMHTDSVILACPNSPSLSLVNYEAILYSGSWNTLRNNTLGSHLHRVHHTDFTYMGYTLLEND